MAIKLCKSELTKITENLTSVRLKINVKYCITQCNNIMVRKYTRMRLWKNLQEIEIWKSITARPDENWDKKYSK